MYLGSTEMLRQAVASDIPGIQRVRSMVRENRLVSMVIPDLDVQAAIEVSGRGWVVEADGEIVAFAIGNATSGNIWALFVHPEHERRGYGRRLHDTMLDWLWSQGLNCLWLTTEPGTRAQAFYEASGWQRKGLTASGEMRYEMRGGRMKRVTGIGGIFFKAKDPVALRAWYQRHLGIDVLEWGGAAFGISLGATSSFGNEVMSGTGLRAAMPTASPPGARPSGAWAGRAAISLRRALPPS